MFAPVIVAAFVLSVFAPSTLRAQQKSAPAAQNTPTPAATPTPQSIPPLTEIATGLDDQKRLLQEVKRRLGDDSVRQTVQQSLESLSTELDTRSKQTDEVLQSMPSLAELQDLSNEWAGQERRLAGLQRSIADRAAVLNTDIAWLNTQQERWTKLLNEIQLDPTLTELQSTVGQSLTDLQDTTALAQDQL